MADKTVGAIVAFLKLDAKQFQAQMKAARASAGGLGKGLQTVGRGFVAAAAATAGFGLAVAGVVKVAGDFEQTMANVGAVTGATGEGLKELSSIAIEMGKATIFSASEAGEAMFALGSQGVKTADAFRNLLKPALDLAAATQSEIASTTESVIGNIRAFNLDFSEAGRIANVFSAANENSALTMQRLTDSLRPVAPLASSLGVSFEATAAALGTLANRNIKAEEAGTALRNIFLRLLGPVGKAKTILDKAGLTSNKLAVLLKNPVKLMEALRDATLSDADAKTIFGARALNAFLILREGTEDMQNLQDAITGTDSATRIAARQLDTFNSQVKLLKSALEALFITIGTDLLPAFRSFVERMTENTKKIIEFVEENRALVKGLIFSTAKWLAITTVILGVAAVIGKIILLAPALKAAILAVTAGSPWIILAVAVGVAINAIVDIIGKIFEAKGEAKELAQRTENLNKKYQKTSDRLRKVSGDWEKANDILEDQGIKIGFVIKSEEDLVRALRVLGKAQDANIEKDQTRTEANVLNAQKRAETAQTESDAKVAALAEELNQKLTLQGDHDTSLNEMDDLRTANAIDNFAGLSAAGTNFFESQIKGTLSAGSAFNAFTKSIRDTFIRSISQMIAKATVFFGVIKPLGGLFGFGGGLGLGSFLGFNKGGMVPGAQGGLLPRGEDLLVGVQRGEGILSRAGVASIGGAKAVDAINSSGGGGGSASVGGDTFIFNVSSLDGTINEETREAMIRMFQEEKRRFAGALA